MNTASFDFTGSVVLVTGGGSGIGRAVTRAFLDAGATVAITGRRPDRLAEALEGYPRERTAALPADVSDGRQVAALVADVVGRFGRLDVVVDATPAGSDRPDHRAERRCMGAAARHQRRCLLPPRQGGSAAPGDVGRQPRRGLFSLRTAR